MIRRGLDCYWDLWRRRSSWWVAGTLFLVCVVFSVALFAPRGEKLKELSGKSDLPAIPDGRQCGYTPDELKRYANDLGDKAREHYIRTQYRYDIAFPLIYAALFTVVLVRVWDRFRAVLPNVVWLLLLPPAAAVLDLAENLTLIAILSDPGAWSDTPATAAGYFTVAKWLLVKFCFFMCLGSLVATAGASGPTPER